MTDGINKSLVFAIRIPLCFGVSALTAKRLLAGRNRPENRQRREELMTRAIVLQNVNHSGKDGRDCQRRFELAETISKNDSRQQLGSFYIVLSPPSAALVRNARK